MQQFMSCQFLTFLFTGGSAAAINFGSRIFYSQWLGFFSAVILAYIAGIITVFVLAKLLIFKGSQQSLRRSAMFFVLVNLVAVFQAWGQPAWR
ncbi:hypothetical protein C4K00_1671 [Pseudomonas synxantha]|uniref:GtrA family protein n=1 Tax=Pseudomonas synxantha TaxID=47883 RepID=UPI000F707A2C|nr:GtrA family protein [Pseudomonas synxantha]AZE71914.1 hypothetical protein C4K00_1671 [Pseudomonas synxantha]